MGARRRFCCEKTCEVIEGPVASNVKVKVKEKRGYSSSFDISSLLFEFDKIINHEQQRDQAPSAPSSWTWGIWIGVEDACD